MAGGPPVLSGPMTTRLRLASALMAGSLALPLVGAVAGGAPTASAATTGRSCRVPAGATSVTATPVPGVASDWDLRSFDGTVIRLHWFPAPGAGPGHLLPTVLMGPGWGESGDTDTAPASGQGGLFAGLGIHQLWDAGYNVLTWDPRGFGQSTGAAEVDSPAVEGRDMQRIISWVATRPGVRLDRPGDPRIGMVGLSYGGGIQLTTAAVDCRVDAIVPSWAWHSLTTSLDKTGITKNGWSNLLYSALAGRPVDPHLVRAHEEALSSGTIDAADRAWFAARGPGALVARIRVPTLLVQGEEDDLFTLDEAIANYRVLHHDHVPVSMVWTCGGHGVCLSPAGDTSVATRATLAWLDRYLKGNRHQRTGPVFTFVDQDGTSWSADRYPLPTSRTVTASGRGTLALRAGGGSGPATVPPGSTDPLGSIAGPVTPARAAHALDVPVALHRRGVVVGAPTLRLTYRGTVPPGARPTRVFAQIVDDTSGLVLDNQITPVALTLDGRTHTATVPLETVVYRAEPGARLTLQLVATTVAYAQPRLGGTVHFDHVSMSLPVVSGLSAGS